jgi:hypothetical protein
MKIGFHCDTFSVVPSMINNIPKYVLLFSGALYNQQHSKICAAPLEICFCFWLWDFDFDKISQNTYTFSTFWTPFLSNFCFAWCQQAGEGGCYDTLVERYGERIHCFTLTPNVLVIVLKNNGQIELKTTLGRQYEVV